MEPVHLSLLVIGCKVYIDLLTLCNIWNYISLNTNNITIEEPCLNSSPGWLLTEYGALVNEI